MTFMDNEKQIHGDDLEGWSHIALGLSRLKTAAEYAQEFGQQFSKYLSKEDRVEVAGLHSRFDSLYWKYWEKLVKKIRGLT